MKVAFGGGSFESSDRQTGGLTLILANSFEPARVLSNGTPMNEIGETNIMIWDLFYANLSENTDWLSSSS